MARTAHSLDQQPRRMLSRRTTSRTPGLPAPLRASAWPQPAPDLVVGGQRQRSRAGELGIRTQSRGLQELLGRHAGHVPGRRPFRRRARGIARWRRRGQRRRDLGDAFLLSGDAGLASRTQTIASRLEKRRNGTVPPGSELDAGPRIPGACTACTAVACALRRHARKSLHL